MDRKEIARQLRQEAAQMIKAAELLEGGAVKRLGRPPGTKAAKKPAAKKRRAYKKKAATTE